MEIYFLFIYFSLFSEFRKILDLINFKEFLLKVRIYKAKNTNLSSKIELILFVNLILF